MSTTRLGNADPACADDAVIGEPVMRVLESVRSQLAIDRLSVHSIDPAKQSFRVVGSVGEGLLIPGTELPTGASSQIDAAADGRVFRSSAFAADPGFDRAIDRLCYQLGFRSGCSLPLYGAGQIVGALGATCQSESLDCDALLTRLAEVSSRIALALHGGQARLRVLVCHEDEFLSTGVARILEQALDADVTIGDTSGAILEHGVRPFDAIVCDSFFDRGRLPRFLRDLRAAGSSAPVLVVAASDTALSREQARLGEADDYGALDEGSAGIVARVRELVAGRARAPLPAGVGHPRDEAHLTAQESRVLLLLERGLRFKQIAVELSISEATAKGHARALFVKLGAHSRGEAVYAARRLGVLDFLGDDPRPVPVLTV
jgi:DNA-binding NarL/FixJ family response regulator